MKNELLQVPAHRYVVPVKKYSSHSRIYSSAVSQGDGGRGGGCRGWWHEALNSGVVGTLNVAFISNSIHHDLEGVFEER